jgi:hypothetical protein
MTLVTGIIGIVLLLAFLGVLVWWIKALPLTIIVLVVVSLMIYDFVRTLRLGDRPEG